MIALVKFLLRVRRIGQQRKIEVRVAIPRVANLQAAHQVLDLRFGDQQRGHGHDGQAFGGDARGKIQSRQRPRRRQKRHQLIYDFHRRFTGGQEQQQRRGNDRHRSVYASHHEKHHREQQQLQRQKIKNLRRFPKRLDEGLRSDRVITDALLQQPPTAVHQIESHVGTPLLGALVGMALLQRLPRKLHRQPRNLKFFRVGELHQLLNGRAIQIAALEVHPPVSA